MKVKAIQTSDRAHFYLNGTLEGVQYQHEIGTEIEMYFEKGDNTLELLVENMGRVNYGYKLQAPTQKKGIRTGVMTDIHFESGWEQYALPLDNVGKIDFSGGWKQDDPAFYRYEFEAEEPRDTFLDCRGLGKGAAFINGFNLGRYWYEGPVLYLYIPAPLIKRGKNEIIIFETEGNVNETLSFSDRPVYG